ncbi:HpcH/HpaI aldolase/citrate lyase family protein [Actinomadura livida]|uniref:Citrate lyase subunit beta/citryl-CoA lyase/(S)-citramalyl-CoA lyase n=1 Tax=Actinomadura livida TaxID=79909 RepID=A0A7W7I7F5_9ACTN|nr:MULTISPECIES: CoA ester lyase [Actinomadura]MBB4771917.1 citrate lyase subunit beta/citryl-CoA lyase/(S)-citramalyl-CoA lyase [Actinomadura catellatispora]
MGTLAVPRGATWLITPATAPGRFSRARDCGADVALLDLEDSVPQQRKDQARAIALQHLAKAATEAADGEVSPLGLRLNAPGTLPGLRDLVAVAESGVRPAVLLVPKVESPRDVDLVGELLRTDEDEPKVWALIETPLAIQRLHEILASRFLAGVVFGAADYAAAAGCRRTAGGLRYPRAALSAGAAAAALPAIDSPYFDLANDEGLRREAEEACDLGFTGKGAVHPRQLAAIREAFQPSPQELDRARATVRAADSMDAAEGVTHADGSMVGPPLVAAARSLTDQAPGGMT